MILKNDPRPHFCGECRGTMIVFEHWFTYITPLNFSRYDSRESSKPSVECQWNVCAAHVNNVSSNLVECIDFSDLSGATVGWSRFSELIT